jgi:hypothetical protein
LGCCICGTGNCCGVDNVVVEEEDDNADAIVVVVGVGGLASSISISPSAMAIDASDVGVASTSVVGVVIVVDCATTAAVDDMNNNVMICIACRHISLLCLILDIIIITCIGATTARINYLMIIRRIIYHIQKACNDARCTTPKPKQSQCDAQKSTKKTLLRV